MIKKIIVGVILISGITFNNADAALLKKEVAVVENVSKNKIELVTDKGKVKIYKRSVGYKRIKTSDVVHVIKIGKNTKLVFDKKETIKRKKEVRKLMNELYK